MDDNKKVCVDCNTENDANAENCVNCQKPLNVKKEDEAVGDEEVAPEVTEETETPAV